MDEHELLLRHAAGWARDRKRVLDAELVALALGLRADHDQLTANQWPAGSAEQLMLMRWPSHGPADPPDVDVLVSSLDTFWGFLRSTGRMSAASAQPAELRREAKRAAPKMAAACADQSRFGTAKQMLAYGSEIGIDLSDVPDMDEANRRMQQIVEAWNAQPDDVRMDKSRNWPVHGEPVAYDQDDGPDPEQFYLDADTLPDSPLFRFDEDGDLLLPEPMELALSAAQARASGLVQSMVALAEWVGDGKPITTTDTLRPAVGKEAYVELRLGDWERERAKRTSGGPDARPADSTDGESPAWRSATESLALERLWRPALGAGLIITSGRTARFDPSAVPDSPAGWQRLAMLASTMLLSGWDGGECADLAIEILTSIDIQFGKPARPEEIAETWWDSAANTWREALDSATADDLPDPVNGGLLRDISDQEVLEWLAVFADHGIFREENGRLIGTEFGRDVLIVFVATMMKADPWAD